MTTTQYGFMRMSDFTRPIPAREIYSELSLGQTQLLRTRLLRSGCWRVHPIGHEGTVESSLLCGRSA